jgi:uncharacterized membrane protein YqjE
VSYQPPPTDEDRSVGELVFDVSERVSTLVREEIELAKTEVSEKLTQLVRGGVVGIAAGTFAFLGLILLMVAIAFLINDIFNTAAWVGFLIEAVVFFLIAAGAGYFAYRSMQAGAPPTPDLAIEEGKRIRQTLEAGTTPPPAKEPQAGP